MALSQSKLELAVGNARNINSGKNDLQSFLESLYSLGSQSPKNMQDLKKCAHYLHITHNRIGKNLYCSLGDFIFQSGISSRVLFSSIRATFFQGFQR